LGSGSRVIPMAEPFGRETVRKEQAIVITTLDKSVP
jgi:hypothetical protein